MDFPKETKECDPSIAGTHLQVPLLKRGTTSLVAQLRDDIVLRYSIHHSLQVLKTHLCYSFDKINQHQRVAHNGIGHWVK